MRQNLTIFNPPCLTQTLFSLVLVIQTGLGGAVSLGLGTPSPKWSRSSQALKVSFAVSLQHAVLSVTAWTGNFFLDLWCCSESLIILSLVFLVVL